MLRRAAARTVLLVGSLLPALGRAAPASETEGPEGAPTAEAPALEPAGEAPPRKDDSAVSARQLALEARLAEQDARIRELEGKRSETAPPAPAAPFEAAGRSDPLAHLEDEDFKKSVPLFGSPFRFAVGGYVKLDALYDLNGTADHYSFALAGIRIPSEPPSDGVGYFNMFVRETRLNLDVRYSKKDLPANQLFVEFDFWSSQPDALVTPRLRHAYFRYGDFLVGQTWSTLSDLRPLPYIVDFAFADSVNALRAPQVRWQKQVREWLVLRAGISLPESGGIDNPSSLPGTATIRFPRAAFGASFDFERGFISTGVSGTELRWAEEASGSSTGAFAWSAVLNSKLFLDRSKRAFLSAMGTIGNGNAETIGAFGGQNANATLVSPGRLETIVSYHLTFGGSYRVVDQFTTNAAFAWGDLVPPPERDPDSMQSAWSFHVNGIAHLTTAIDVGLEYMVGYRRNTNGESGRAERVQTMALYRF